MSGDLAARYSRSANTYETMWSPIIRPMARPLIDAIDALGALGTIDRGGGLVLDVGCGVGALFGDLTAGGGRVAGIDRSEGMLLRAAARGPVVCADATLLPVAPGAASVAVAVFMLHHIPDPAAVLREMAGALAPGGIAATATWGANSEHEAGDVWDALMDRHGAPGSSPAADSRDRLDDDTKAAAMLTRAGLTVERAWTAPREHRYSADELCALHARYGRRNERLLALPAGQRDAVVAEFRAEVDRRPGLLFWRPDVVYALARV